MKLFNIISARLHGLVQRETVIDDIDKEFGFHLEMETKANLERGMSNDEARRAAIRSFGNFDSVRDKAYEVRGGGMMEALLQDIRYAARSLVKQKTFTVVAVITLALGIGANTAIFSVVNQLLLRPLPYADADRLVMLWEVSSEGQHQNVTSRANFSGWRDQNTSFEGMAAFTDQRLNLTGSGEAEEVSVQFATTELFRVLGVEPILGRGMTAEDGKTGAPNIVVLGYNFWQRRFGGDAQIMGKPIMLNGEPFTVVGVMPPNFQWHIRQRSGTGRAAEIWTVLPMPPLTGENATSRGRFLSVVARLKGGATLQQATADMKTIASRLEQDAPRFNRGTGTEVIPLRDQFVGNVRFALWIILGAVGLVLLIACANVANLLLSRAAAREKEIAVRAALGAGRWRIVRQLLTESLLLATLGSLLGLALAWWGIKALVAISPRDLVNLQHVGLNLTVLAWTMGLSLLTGIIFGLVPALEASRPDLNGALKEGKGTEGQSPRSRRLRSALVVTEVALALILLASAGLLVKSFNRLLNIDRGFNPDNLMTMVVRLPEAKYRDDAQMVSFFRRATERIRSLPGVSAVGMVNYLPLYGGLGARTGYTIEGRPAELPGDGPSTHVRVTDASYFSTMGIPLLRGRNFTDFETNEARHVVLISESMARQHFPGEDPIGKRVTIPMSEKPVPTEIVGIVGDVRYESLVEEPEPTVYMPHPELTYPFMTLVIRTPGDPSAIVPAVKRELNELDPDQPVSDVRTMSQVMADTVARARFNTLLLALFAGLATLLAAVGIFGVMNYSLTMRTREIGLRMALGAQPGKVVMLMLKQGLVLTLIGTAIGLAGALALTRLMSSLLFGVHTADPATFAVIVLLLMVVSLIACYLPARRAARIDPLIALRAE
ncbi:MAG TPA: ABC transporter permease [Pyrinomonadaceae bacterium]|nr:ABC transporter permease [Pyrinomonadaceae bacterium]